MQAANVNAAEVGKFDQNASRWWDADGPFRPLHDLNPARFEFVRGCVALDDRRVVDVGCGGGLLCESLARARAHVTGIDVAPGTIDVARLHALSADVTIDYRCVTPEELARGESAGFDLVTCMELLEHVPDPAALIESCAQLVRPGGDLIFSTLNRTAAAFLFGVIAAEYVARILPRGTHEFRRFIRPSELAAWARHCGLEVQQLRGLAYNPLTRRARLTHSVAINYLMHLRRPAIS